MMATLGMTTPMPISPLRLRFVLLLLLEFVEVLEEVGDAVWDEGVVAAVGVDAVFMRMLFSVVGMGDNVLAVVVEDVLIG